jgi:hypothetical protein
MSTIVGFLPIPMIPLIKRFKKWYKSKSNESGIPENTN